MKDTDLTWSWSLRLQGAALGCHKWTCDYLKTSKVPPLAAQNLFKRIGLKVQRASVIWVLLIWNSLYHLQRTIAIIYQRTEAWGYSNRVPELEMLLLVMELAPQTTQTLLFCLWQWDFPVSSVWMPIFHPSKNEIKQAQLGWRKVQSRQNFPGGGTWGRLKSDLSLTLPRDTASSA